MKRKRTVKQKLDRQIAILITYLVVIVCAVAFLLSIMNDKDKTLFGYTARIVVSGSMEPDIQINSLNIVKSCDIEDIEIGDVICFNFSQDTIHRVIEKTTNTSGQIILHTKGDANERADDIEINSDMLIGKVVYTFNGIAPLIEKYSISPGNIDSITLSRNIVSFGVVIGIAAFIAWWILQIVRILVKSFSKENTFDATIDKYINDIDELILYKELLLNIKETKAENKPETRFQFIFNRLSRAKTEVEIKNLHHNIKQFKRAIKNCLVINRLGSIIDDENTN